MCDPGLHERPGRVQSRGAAVSEELPIPDRDELEAQLAELRARLDATGRAVEGHTAWLSDLERWVSSCVRAMALFGAQPLGREAGVSGAPDVLGRVLAWIEIQTVMSWIRDAAVLDESPLVSVTIATRDRPAALTRAISSVREQSYTHLELVVVDDSEQPHTAELLERIDDPRLRVVRPARRCGAGAAFNAGREAVSGELVTFLDDDNIMHRDWLRSVVWAFQRRPEIDALYGARIIEDIGAADGRPSGSFPAFEFLPYERRRHERANFVDRNTIALRARLSTVSYDEQLSSAIDWDHSLRVFAQAPPLALPAIACYYGTLVTNRVSDRPERLEAVRTVRSRAHSSRPLRVHAQLGSAEAAPLEPALSALADSGAKVTRSTDQELVDADPDLVLLGSAQDAADQLELLESQARPFAVLGSTAASALVEHPLRLEIDQQAELEPALRSALTRWLYARV